MASTSNQMPSTELIESLMKDPMKRALILQLLSKQKNNLEGYRRKEDKTKTTPLKKVSKLVHCESPTALQRRRALEQKSTSESSSSELSEIASELKGPKLPFQELLKGVKAYIDVKRDNEDRSEGIKAIMKLMGATIRDTFTSDVTHVVFKDGSFTTFEKAKLMKVHLVSVLWLDAVRRNNCRVPEKNYPPFGSKVCDENVSILCSQIQKDYEDVVKDERRRRHTMMTPKTSITSYLSAQNFPLTDDESVEKRTESPDLTSDDSDCGIIDGQITKRSRNTNLTQNSIIDETVSSSESASLLSHINKNRRKTINVTSAMVLTPNIKPTTSKQIEETAKQPKSAKKTLQELSMQSSPMSSLRMSDSDKTKSDLVNSRASSTARSRRSMKSSDATQSGLMNSKDSGKENSIGAVNSTMSSLRLSDSLDARSNKEQSTSGGKLPSPSKKSRPSASLGSSTSSIDMTPSTRKVKRTTLGQLAPENSSSAKKTDDKTVDIRKKNRKTMSVVSSDSDPDEQKPRETKVKRNRADTSITSHDSESRSPKKTPKIARNRKSVVTASVTDESSKNTESTNSTSSHDDALEKTPKIDEADRVRRSRRTTLFGCGTPQKNTTNDKVHLIEKSRRSVLPAQGVTFRKHKTATGESFRTTETTSSASSQNETAKEDESYKMTRPGKSTLIGRDTPQKNNGRPASPVSVERSARSERNELSNSENEESSNTEKRNRNSTSASVADDNTQNKPESKKKPVASSRRSVSVKSANASKKDQTSETSTTSNEGSTPLRRSRRSIIPNSKFIEKGSSQNENKKTPVVRLPRVVKESKVKTPEHETVTKAKSPQEGQSSGEKKTRKLYNPNEINVFLPPEDDKERQEYLKQKSQKSPDDVFINPNNIVMSSVRNKRKPNTSDVSSESSDEEINLTPPPKVKKTRKKDEEPIIDSDLDEQRSLLEELQNDRPVKSRHSERLCFSQVKPKYTFSSNSSASSNNLPITPIKRRSTLDFVPISLSQQKRKLKLDPKRTTSIVCTKLHRPQVVDFENTVAKLGRFFVEDKVTGKTSHLVAGEAKRTINMLKAIARGCWIVKHEWLLKSQEKGKWLSEEDYELTEFSPSVQQCRLQKEAFGPLYSMDIFKDCGFIYLAKETTPKPADLRELISICKGRITTVYRNASIVVGEHVDREGVTCVGEMWILDSIVCNRLKSFKNYLIKQDVPNEVPHSPDF